MQVLAQVQVLALVQLQLAQALEPQRLVLGPEQALAPEQQRLELVLVLVQRLQQ